VALQYRPEIHNVPRVVAKGQNLVAERLINLARQHSVPLEENTDLATLLSKLDLGETIPEELYQAVAEILAFIYRMNKKLGR
jgi:FlhB-like protein